MSVFSKNFKIGNKKIGYNSQTFIVAEAGVNHNGDLKKAFKLVDLACKAGVDAIKFQTFNTEASTTKNLKKAKYQKKSFNDKETQYSMLKKLELDIKDLIKIQRYCKKKKIIFFSTPSDTESFNILEKLKVPCYKISSVDLNNDILIKNVCATNKPVIISTGMSNLNDILHTKKIVCASKNKKIIFLHCVSSYPTNLYHTNLRSINFIADKIGSLVGFSDHTLDIEGASLAIACGACLIEKHFTLNKKLPGPDHKISLNFLELKKFVKKIRDTEKILGKKIKKIHQSEKNTLSATKKVFVANKTIKKGTKLRLNMLLLKSGGKGLNYKSIKKYLGKRVKKRIIKDSILSKNFF